MAESPEERFNRVRDAIQQSILTSYPNPERVGCPGEAVVREVAGRDELRKDDAWEHITHCSPCYAEFLGFKDEFRKMATRSKVTRRVVISAGGVTVAGIAAGVVWNRQYRVHIVDLDLGEHASFRSAAEAGPSRGSPVVLPTGRVRLRLALAKGSEPGFYQINIWKDLEGAPLVQAGVPAVLRDQRWRLETDIEISLDTGNYTLGFRNDHREAWRYLPVMIN